MTAEDGSVVKLSTASEVQGKLGNVDQQTTPFFLACGLHPEVA